MYIGAKINRSKVDRYKLNLVVSSCGTGKSYYFANELLPLGFGDGESIRPEQVLFVTSRTLAAEQQARQYSSLLMLGADDQIVRYWAGIDEEALDPKTRILTYDKLIALLVKGRDSLANVKCVVLDEVHSVYSDLFINNMPIVQMWLRYELHLGEKYFFGLTATPGILYDMAGVDYCLISEPLYRYKAKQLWCVDLDTLVDMVNDGLDGKTIIMCQSVRRCYSLQKMIRGSVVLAGRSGDDYIPAEMDDIRLSIVERCRLPDKAKVLIATSTAREGFTFTADSGIKNVVSFYTDEMNITQFVGRCRYDVDNLIIVDMPRKSNPETYFGLQEIAFTDFCKNKSDDWFDLVSDIVDHDSDNAKIIVKKSKGFCGKAKKPKEYNPTVGLFAKSNSKGVLDKYVAKSLLNDVKIVGKDEKARIIEEITDLGVFSNRAPPLTWLGLEKILNHMGYDIENGRQTLDGKRVRYKVVKKRAGQKQK